MKKRPTDSNNARPASVLDWPAQAGVAQDVLRELRARQRRRSRRRAATGIAGAALLAIAAVFFRPGADSAEGTLTLSLPATVVVARPDRQLLPDGSVVELRDGASIAVEFSAGKRLVLLHEGEAHFAVAKDAQRPFVVAAGGIDVRAVGTEFSVHRADDTVDVLVNEGQVAVTRRTGRGPDAPVDHAVELAAGSRVMIPIAQVEAPAVERISLEQTAARLAWRVPRLEFSATPLIDALPLFNQHSDTRLVLGDASLAQLQLSGVIRADNIEALLSVLEGNYGVRAERQSGGVIVLRAGPR